ncbi:MAG: hypothetical protein AB7I09_19730, partial [Planctomycetota bacterium]
CFPAGTLVATPAGDVPIEEIAAGCVVYGYDVETGQVVEREVVQVFRNSRSTTTSWDTSRCSCTMNVSGPQREKCPWIPTR